MMDHIREYTAHIVGFLGMVLTAIGTWYATKTAEVRKSKRDENDDVRADFNALLDANTNFRNEIRNDLIQAKEELEKAKYELHLAKERITILEQDLAAKQNQVLVLELQVARLSAELIKFQDRAGSPII